jgi:hypothetical protein
MNKMAKQKPGTKPMQWPPEKIAQVEALAAYLTVDQICDYLSICKQTFYNHMDTNQELRDAYRKGHAKAIGAVANGLVKQAMEGNITAAIFFLKTKGGWKETNGLEVTGLDGGPIDNLIQIEFVNPPEK